LFISESDLIALVPLSQALVVVKLSGESQILVGEFVGFFGLFRESPLKLLDQACFLRGGAIAGRWIIQVLDCIRVLVFLRHENSFVRQEIATGPIKSTGPGKLITCAGNGGLEQAAEKPW
jgi:hypothetical protein